METFFIKRRNELVSFSFRLIFLYFLDKKHLTKSARYIIIKSSSDTSFVKDGDENQEKEKTPFQTEKAFRSSH